MNTFTSRKLTEAFEEGRAICENLDIPIGCVTELAENPRLSATWGRCRKITQYTYKIEVKSKLLDEDVPHDVLMNTMLHELIHTCNGCMNHGELFKRYAARLNRAGWYVNTYVTEAELKAVPQEPTIYRYRVTCEACGKEWNYSRRGAVVRSLQRDLHSCTCPCGARNFKLEDLM